MGSITLFDGFGKLVFFDSGHTHGGSSSYHVHEVDLSKLTLEDLERLERDSRNNTIELHQWKTKGATTTRDATPDEVEQIERMRNY